MSDETIEYVPPQSLGVVPQVRKQVDLDEEAGLMQSIREVGMLQPIRARRVGEKLVVVDGHRRRSAALKLGMAKVPVIIEQGELRDQDALLRQMIANIQRSDLSAVEKAEGIAGYMRAEKCSAAQAAAKMGVSAPTASRLLALLQLPPDIRDKVAIGEIPASAAYQLAQVGDAQERAGLAQQVAAGTLTREGVSARRKGRDRAAPAPDAAKPTRATIALGAGRSIAVSAVGLTLELLIQLCEELLAKARKARPQGLELSTFVKVQADQAKA